MIIGIILLLLGMNTSGTIGIVLMGLGIMSIVSSVSISVETSSSAKSKKSEPCKLHAWTYDKDEKLYCSVCKKYTHEIMSDYEKPY